MFLPLESTSAGAPPQSTLYVLHEVSGMAAENANEYCASALGVMHVPGAQRSRTTPLQPSRTMDSGLVAAGSDGWDSSRAPPFACVPIAG